MNLLLQLPLLGILSPFISLMGFIINYIYKFLLLFGITKVAICIIVFTVVIKIAMLPLTFKQQKFTKVSAKMNPEIQAISEKYRGKRDNASMQKMQEEQQAIYKKYGANPMSGCLPMIIIMILLFALYPVVYSIPTYVDDVQVHYNKIVTAITDSNSGIDKTITSEIVSKDKDGNEKTTEITYNLSDAMYAFYTANGVYVRTAPEYKINGNSDYGTYTFKVADYIAIMAGFSPANWEDFFSGKTYKDVNVRGGNIEAWNIYAPQIKEALNKTYQDDNGKEIVPTKVREDIVKINTFLGLNIFDTPTIKSITVLIPIISALLQFLQMQISMAFNKPKGKKKSRPGEADPASTMKTMNYIMPIFSGIICLSMPIGVGIYWITSSVVSIILQVAIDLKLQTVEIETFAEESTVKEDKRLEKLGVHKQNDGQMASVAKIATKSLSNSSNKANSSNNKRKDAVIPEEKRHLSASNIAAIANIYRNDEEDDNNDKEGDNQ